MHGSIQFVFINSNVPYNLSSMGVCAPPTNPSPSPPSSRNLTIIDSFLSTIFETFTIQSRTSLTWETLTMRWCTFRMYAQFTTILNNDGYTCLQCFGTNLTWTWPKWSRITWRIWKWMSLEYFGILSVSYFISKLRWTYQSAMAYPQTQTISMFVGNIPISHWNLVSGGGGIVYIMNTLLYFLGLRPTISSIYLLLTCVSFHSPYKLLKTRLNQLQAYGQSDPH